MFNFAIKMKKRLYIFHLWAATMLMLLSTAVMHHHHASRICMVVEECTQDGRMNDEHTHHQENEEEGCSVQQMHHFVINAKVVKSIQKHIADLGMEPLATLPSSLELAQEGRLVAVEWQEATEPLGTGFFSLHSLRGPPMFS